METEWDITIVEGKKIEKKTIVKEMKKAAGEASGR